MKKIQLIYPLFKWMPVFAFLLVLSACGEGDDDPKPDNPDEDEDKTELLFQAWKMSNVLVNNKEYAGNEFTAWELSFKKDGTYTLFDGKSTGSGAWEAGNGNELVLDKGTAGEINFTVLRLEKDALELQIIQLDENKNEVKIVFQMQPK